MILAGGTSSRMGSDKAQVSVGGRPMATWVADAMRSVFDTPIVVGRSGSLAGLDAFPDQGDPHLGPLSGLVTALDMVQRPIVMVAVDQPLVRTETLQQLARLAAAGNTAVCIDEIAQVTCAAYDLACLGEATGQLANKGSIRRMLTLIEPLRIERETWSRWGEDGRSWYSMDSTDAIVEAEQRFRLKLLG